MEYQGYKVTYRGESPRYMQVGRRGFIKPSDVPTEVMEYFNSLGTPKKEVDSVPTEPVVSPLEATDEEIQEAYKQMEALQAEPQDSIAPDVPPFTEMELALMEEVETLREQAEENERYDAASLAKIFYEEFGVYTMWAGEDPKVGDTHPITAKPMTRYDMGIAYQARRKSIISGSQQNLRARQSAAIEARQAPALHEEEMAKREADPNHNAPAYKTFNERTSVEGQKYSQSSTFIKNRDNDPISDEATAEPNLNGQTIRPYW